MKKLLILTLLAAPIACISKELLTIKNSTTESRDVVIAKPIKGFVFAWSSEKVTLLPAQTHSFELNVGQASFVTIRTKNSTLQLLVRPDEIFSLELTGDKPIHLVKAPNLQGQIMLNDLLAMPSKDQFANKDFSRVVQMVDSLRGTLLLANDKLYRRKKVDAHFHKAASEEIKYFFADYTGEVITRYFNPQTQKDESLKTQVLDYWSGVYRNLPIDQPLTVRPTRIYNYVSAYLFSLRSEPVKFANATDITAHLKEMLNYRIQTFKTSLSGELLEHCLAQFLHFTCLQKSYQEILVTEIEDFRSKFPDSEYLAFLNPCAAEVKAYQTSVASAAKAKVVFLPDTLKFNDIVRAIPNKYILVDLWATWCGPCVENFAFNNKISSFLQENDIGKLYISLDADHNEQKWKGAIKFHNLEGHHVRSGMKSLLQEVLELIGAKGAFGIPRYILVDNTGRILHADLPQPRTTAGFMRAVLESRKKDGK